jgi:hypothetical protein
MICNFILEIPKGLNMITLMILQRGTPDIVNLILLLVGVLLCLLALNSLYDWLRTKPWNKNVPPTESSEDEIGQINSDEDDKKDKTIQNYSGDEQIPIHLT